MRFIVDECCPRLYAYALREAGHDVTYVPDFDARASDGTIAGLAIEESRVVVTADYDFGELAVRHRRHVPGVLLVAPSLDAIPVRADRLAALVAERGELLMGSLTIMEPERVRFRPLG
jgi:predicted nuclease of predicted toxin-antitoxin system